MVYVCGGENDRIFLKFTTSNLVNEEIQQKMKWYIQNIYVIWIFSLLISSFARLWHLWLWLAQLSKIAFINFGKSEIIWLFLANLLIFWALWYTIFARQMSTSHNICKTQWIEQIFFNLLPKVFVNCRIWIWWGSVCNSYFTYKLKDIIAPSKFFHNRNICTSTIY